MTPILQVDSVSKRFGGLMALSEVAFEVRRGEIMGLIGPNGAGKTTMFNCVAGVIKPTVGKILFSPEGGTPSDLAGLKPEKVVQMGVARTFQNIRLFSSLSVLDNVRVGRHSRTSANFLGAVLRTRTQREEEEAIIDEAMRRLEFVGLAKFALQRASSLSYGDQRRLEIARALATDPRLILLDEPAAGMNPQETRALMALIRRILEEGVSVVLIEHDMKLVMAACDRIAVLDHGMLIAEGAPREIRENPQVIEAYLGRGAAHV